MQMDGFDPEATRPDFDDRTPEDRWLLTELNRILPTVEEGMQSYNYAVAREAVDRVLSAAAAGWTINDVYLCHCDKTYLTTPDIVRLTFSSPVVPKSIFCNCMVSTRIQQNNTKF